MKLYLKILLIIYCLLVGYSVLLYIQGEIALYALALLILGLIFFFCFALKSIRDQKKNEH